jgi:hypothetical protein
MYVEADDSDYLAVAMKLAGCNRMLLFIKEREENRNEEENICTQSQKYFLVSFCSYDELFGCFGS